MELVGRRTERDALDGALRRALGGRRTVVSIRGEAGIGKTALLDELTRQAAGLDARSLRIAVSEVEQEIGFVGLATLFDGVEPDDVATLHPVHADALAAARGFAPADGVEPLAIAAGLAELLRHMSASGPVVLIVDDAHWLDRSTAGALSFAIRILADVPLLVAVAARPTASPLDPARLVDAGDLVGIEPAPLSLAGVRELLAATRVHLDRVDLVRVAEATAGNPLHVVETARLMHAGTPVDAALVPASLRDAVDADLARLDEAALWVLTAAAVMVDPQVRHLRELLAAFDGEGGAPAIAADVDAAVAAAERLEIASSGDGVIRFRHPLLRDRLADRLTPTERRRLHRRMATLDLPLSVRARHLSEAAEGIDDDVAGLLDGAVDDARARGALDEALAHALCALRLTGPGEVGADRRRRVKAAAVAVEAGDARRARQLLGDDLRTILTDELNDIDAADAIDVLMVGVLAVAGVDGTSAALAPMERLIDLLEPADPRRAIASGWVVRALLYTNVARAIERAESMLRIARSERSAPVVAALEAALTAARALAGDPVAPSGNVGVADAEPLEDLPWAVLEDHLATAVWTDDHTRAEMLVARGRERLDRSPSIQHQHNALMHEGDLRTRQGRLAEAIDLYEQAWQLAGAMEDGGARAVELALVLAVRGRIDDARARLASSDYLVNDAPPVVHGQARYVRGVVAMLDGRPDHAVDDLRTARRLFDEVGVRDLGTLPVRGELVEALVATGALDEAEAVVAEMLVLAERSGRARGAAEHARARATVHTARGVLDGAAIDAAAAMERYGSLHMPIERARAELLLGSVERRRRHRSIARAHLESARHAFTACGADGFLHRVDAEIDRLGARGSSVDSLTPTEAQIADLVASGRTNDEVAATLFVSRRTVEANLTRIYRKLGVRNRSELAARGRHA